MREGIHGDGACTGRVRRVGACTLTVGSDVWPYAETNRAAIEQHWQRRRAESPKLFNGTVYCLADLDFTDGDLSARLVKTNFMSFLHWRETGFREAGVRDGFGCAIVRSAEGHMLLGIQTAGNINAGLAYPPAGFIDARDAAAGRIVDISASSAREVGEETGLDTRTMERVPGLVVAEVGPVVAIATEWRSPLTAEALHAAVRTHIAADPEPELSDILLVSNKSQLAGRPMPDYARVLLDALLTD